jgi:hypothetical protein
MVFFRRMLVQLKRTKNNIIYDLWKRKIRKKNRAFRKGGTSASDMQYYPAFCEWAAQDDTVFTSFRRNAIYIRIVETISRRYGQAYLDCIMSSDYKFSYDDMLRFAQNDSVGNPRVYRYTLDNNRIFFSPTTLRYIKVLQDICKMMGTENYERIAEIGVGYGGQCRIISSYCEVKEYTLIDLPEVLALTKKYLDRYNELPKLKYIDGTREDAFDNDKMKYDLVISNYAFSELVREVQNFYMKNVILKSKHGYMIWNSISYRTLDGYSDEELLQLIPNSRKEMEIPNTVEDDCVIIW